MLGSGIALLFVTLLAQAYTTEVHVVKYAADGETILNETTVTYQWMEENLPVQGDGITHYYFQGPIFEEQWENTYNLTYTGGDWGSSEEKWDKVDRGSGYVQEEQCNCYPDKDLGACKGTDVRDLCNLVSGMSPGDEVKIKAIDGFYKMFPYSVIYDNEPALGPYVLTWYSMDAKEGGTTSGYTGHDYTTGMRAMFFSDTSVNPWGEHITGIGDMTNHIPEDCWHYYYSSGIRYPALGGYMVKGVSEIAIYSSIELPELSSIVVLPADATLDIGDVQQFNATGYDQSSTEMPNIVVTWTSSNETVGTIDGAGLFTALSAGDAAIAAENGTVTGTASVTVSSPSPASTPTPSKVLTAITISPAAVTLNVGETQWFTGAAYDQNHRKMPDIIVTWMSSNETVGTIDDAGFFTALCAGDATITAENETTTGTAGVTVSSIAPTPTKTRPVVITQSPSPTPAQSPSPLPSATSPAPKATPRSPSFRSPGSGALFVIIGLLVISYVIKRRKNIK